MLEILMLDNALPLLPLVFAAILSFAEEFSIKMFIR